jgi:glycosyltransferase involved in cell wall biosynthesis
MADRVLLFVLGELTRSGAERMLESSAGLWQGAGFEPHILAVGAGPGDFAPVLAACGYHIHHVRFARSPAFIAALAAVHRRIGADIVHIHIEQATFWHALVARLVRPRARLVRTVHGIFRFHGLLRARRAAQRWFMRRMLGVRFTAPSASVAANERAAFANAMAVVPNWIGVMRPFSPPGRAAARAALGVTDDRFLIVSIGNCAEVKNHSTLLRALAELPHDPPWLYLHVGSSAEEEGERVLAARLGLVERVRFLGKCEASGVLAAADLFAMPSRREAFGLAAAEALSTGLPCVLADVEGLRDFAGFSDAIHWCDPASVVSVATAIRAGMTGPRRFPAAADAARAAFAPEAGFQRFLGIYDRRSVR